MNHQNDLSHPCIATPRVLLFAHFHFCFDQSVGSLWLLACSLLRASEMEPLSGSTGGGILSKKNSNTFIFFADLKHQSFTPVPVTTQLNTS